MEVGVARKLSISIFFNQCKSGGGWRLDRGGGGVGGEIEMRETEQIEREREKTNVSISLG
jgi:hypothetical protein